MNDINNLNVIVLNCKSLDARINELRLLVYYSNPDIICLTETWLNNDKVIKYNYNIHGYKCIFQHRLNRLGGGLVTYIKQELYFIKTSVRNFTDGNLEVQFFDIYMKNNRTLTIFNYYNPNKDITHRTGILHAILKRSLFNGRGSQLPYSTTQRGRYN